MRKVKEEKIIEVKEEIQIGNVILEKGDKIQVLKESSANELEYLIIDFIDEPYVTVNKIQRIGIAIRDAFSTVFNENDYRDAVALVNNITNKRNRGTSTSYEGTKFE